MNTQIITLDPNHFDKADLLPAAQLILDGALVVMPTETVYGLGGDATNPSSSKKIYAAKGRPSDNPLIIHIAHPEDAEQYAYTNETYYELARAFMPGPLTLILPKKDSIPFETTGGRDTVAIRCPSHPIAHALLELVKVPIAAPSANTSGKPSPTCAGDVYEDMNGRVDCIIDGGSSEIGLESTIVSLDGPHPVLLRPGGITYDALSCVLPDLEIADAVTHQLKEGDPVLCPGMKYRHYAPSVSFVLLEGQDENVLTFLQNEQKNTDCAILCYDEEIPQLNTHGLFPVGAKDDLASHAHCLFSRLREADRTHPTIIYGHLPPLEGLGLALYNRMIRAAAHTIRHV